MKAILAMAMLVIIPTVNGQGNKFDVIVEMDEVREDKTVIQRMDN